MALLDVLKTLFPDHAQDVDALGVAGAPGVAGLIQPPVSQDAYAKAPGGRAAPPPPRPIDPHSGLRGILSSPDAWQTIAATLKDMGAGFGGGEGTALDRLEGRRDAGRAAEAAQAEQAHLMELGRSVGMTPQELFVLQVKPEIGAQMLADKMKGYSLSQGDMHISDGHMSAYNPKTGVDGGFAYSSTPDGKTDWGEQRPESYSEHETNRHNLTDEQHAAQQLELQSKLGFGNLSLANQREHRVATKPHAASGSGWEAF